MTRAFWVFSTFIVVSFLAMGVILHSIVSAHSLHALEDKVDRDLGMTAKLAQGSIAQGDYMHIEQHMMLWCEADPGIVSFRVTIEGDRPLVEFTRDIETDDILRSTREIISPTGRKVTFELVQDLSKLRGDARSLALVFLVIGLLVAVTFIASLWLILTRLAIRPLKRDIAERRRVEKALRKSRENYTEIFNATSEAIVVHDANDGGILEVNDTMLTMYGLTREEALSSSVADISIDEPPYTQELAIEWIRKTVSDGPQIFEWRCKRKSGERFWVEVSLCASDIHGEGRILAVARDISGRKRARQRLAIERDRAANYLELASVMFVALDADGNVTLINRKGCEILGYSEEEILGKHWFNNFLPDRDSAAVEGVFRQMMAGDVEPVEYYENSVLNKSGEERTIAWHNTVLYDGDEAIGTLSSGDDITERKQAEAAANRSAAETRGIFRAAPVGIGLVVNRVLKRVNDRLCEMTGYSREELIDQNARLLYPSDEEFERVGQEKYAQIEQVGKGSVETRWQRKDGTIIEVLLSSTPLDVGNGSKEVTFTALDITERRRNEEELRNVFELSLDMVSVSDIETSTFLKVNPAFTKTLGYSEEELLSKPFLELLHPDDVADTLDVIECNLRNDVDVINFVNRYRCKNGSYRWLNWAAHPVAENGLSYSVAHDITELKEKQEEIEQARNFLQNTIDNIPESILVIRRDLSVIMANQAAVSIRRETDGDTDIACLKCHQISHNSDTQCDHGDHYCPLEEVFASKATVTVEHIHRDAHGDEFPVEVVAAPIFDENGEVTMVVESSRNISRRREAEVQQRIILDSLGAGVIVVDAADHSVLYINPTAEKIFGVAKEQILGKQCHQLFCTSLEAGCCVEMDADSAATEFESAFLTSSGECLPVLKVVVPVKFSGKDAYLESFMDLRELKTLEAQLRQAQKMEAIGQLAGGVAHDFNNLLQVIHGFGEIAMLGVDADDPIREDLREVMAASGRAAVLVRQLLAFSRKQVLELRDVDLGQVVGDLVKMMGRVIGEHIALEITQGENLGIVHADPGQIEQILMNLCVNARDAMPEGGRITIETENVVIDEEFIATHSWAKPGDYVRLSIADTGFGMDEETLAHAFEPFYTTKDIGEGTGLGLATVYGIVKQHEGIVNVYSEIGEGTKFSIYLPQVEASEEKIDNVIEAPPMGGSETILVAEDDDTVRGLSRLILEKAGYTVLPTADGEEALRVFEERADEIDLALLDVMMPRLGGKGVFDKIHEQRPEMRVLFASGYSAGAIPTAFIVEEALRMIKKPYTADDLLRHVRESLDAPIG